MKTTILTKLQEIENESDVKILYACESGSRAWQFPSPDSDFDVRFIYMRKVNDYLSVAEQTDQLSYPINDELDVYGWDLKKVLKLIRSSNVTPFEWLQSPIVYREEKGFRDELMELCMNYFGQRSNTHHYMGIARGAMESMNSDGAIGIKKLFYVLRPLLAARWCVERNAIAPMSIEPLMTLMPEHVQEVLKDLILKKATVAERFLIVPPKELLEWIVETETICREASARFENKSFSDISLLDKYFRKTLARYDHTRS